MVICAGKSTNDNNGFIAKILDRKNSKNIMVLDALPRCP
jgi:hypothetical protein